jgi:hypothetical protein
VEHADCLAMRFFRISVQTDTLLLDLLPSVTSLTHCQLIEGNSFAIAENGEVFDALL